MTNQSPSHLWLSSQSPRRRELLQQIGVPFQVISVEVTEQRAAHETPTEYVTRLAGDKASAGFAELPDSEQIGAVVLGSDTVVVLEQQVLEKPENENHAVAMLRQLSGRTHRVLTAVALYSDDRQQVALSVTEVSFREVSEAEARQYWATGEPCDKAGAYGIQGLGAVFVTAIQGSYSGVVGLPLETLATLLPDWGVRWWQV